MTFESPLSQSNAAAPDKLTLPPAEEKRASHDERCQSLLTFCERATALEVLLPAGSKTSNYFAPYADIVREMQPSGISRWTPEKVLEQLSGLLISQLSSHLNPEELGYWLAVSHALSAATSTTMKELSARIGEQRSETLSRNIENPLPYRERYS